MKDPKKLSFFEDCIFVLFFKSMFILKYMVLYEANYRLFEEVYFHFTMSIINRKSFNKIAR